MIARVPCTILTSHTRYKKDDPLKKAVYIMLIMHTVKGCHDTDTEEIDNMHQLVSPSMVLYDS